MTPHTQKILLSVFIFCVPFVLHAQIFTADEPALSPYITPDTVEVPQQTGPTYEPGPVTLVWEADVYTPPLYKGKKLYTQGSRVIVEAIPDISVGSPTTYEYTWKKNGVLQANASGIGKRTFAVPRDILAGPLTISVDVYYEDSYVGRAQTTIPLRNSFVALFEESLTDGIFFSRRVHNTYTTDKEEVIVRAFPFFYRLDSANNASFSWRVNNSPVETNQSSLVLRNTSNTTDARVSVTVTGTGSLPETRNASAFLQYEL